MPAVAKALVADLSALQPAHAAYFQANARKFDRSLQPWLTQPAGSSTPSTPAPPSRPPSRSPTTCCRPPGSQNLTPFSMQADIMNGIDPAPQDVALQDSLFSEHKVKAFVYNQQVTDSVTENVPRGGRTAPACRWSGSTRRCRPPATTTSRG